MYVGGWRAPAFSVLGFFVFGGSRHVVPQTLQEAVLPPLTLMICPVMNDALSEVTYRIASAISSGRPVRFIGTPAASAAFRSALPVKRSSIAVSTGPGATALTRTPEVAASSAA